MPLVSQRPALRATWVERSLKNWEVSPTTLETLRAGGK